MKRGIKRSAAALARHDLSRRTLRAIHPPRKLWQLMPIDSEFTVADLGVSFRYRSVPGDFIGRALHWAGLHGWEAEVFPSFVEATRAARNVVDVGSNTGVYSLVAVAAGAGHVQSLEPVPSVVNLLQENVRLNGWESKIEVFPVAAGDTRSRKPLHVPDKPVPDTARLGEGSGGTAIDVDVVAIDSIARRPVDVVKIDVEGAEADVLAGMRGVLRIDRPVLFMEFLPDQPNEAQIGLLHEQDYRFVYLSPSGPLPVKRVEPKDHRWRNYICLPSEASPAWLHDL